MLLRWVLRLCLIILFQTQCVTCTRKSSLTFVIDDTLSMWNDIKQVKEAAEEIMDIVMREKASEIEDIVLLTFNDPDVVLRKKTSNKNEFIYALNQIKIHNYNNRDCPEYAMAGIEMALQESKLGSYIFVFTDASANDYGRVNEIINLSEKKQSQVVFVLTGDCGHPNSPHFKAYHKIAKASNGQVFRVSKDDVKYVLNTIKELIKGQNSVLTSVVVPANNFGYTSVPFTVDDKTEYVIISSSGKQIDLVVTDRSTRGGHRIRTRHLLWKPSSKVVKFDAPSPGTYYAWVTGVTEISVVVYARTDFSFDHGFSEFVPKSLADASKLPIAGQKHHLSISVTDPDHTVDIQTAEILDMNEHIVMEPLSLMKVNGDFYITDTFVSPSSMFKIQVTGKVKKTGRDIRRISKTPVEPQIPPPPVPKAPEVTIAEGSRVYVDYNGEISLTCKVSGYPAPDMTWTSSDSSILSRERSVVELPYDYISYLKLSNLTSNKTYYCVARNTETTTSTKIDVITRSPFTVKTSFSATIPATFGHTLKLKCDISSSYPMEIKWNTPPNPSKISLSADKKVLTIESVGLADQGRYTCETTLKSDPKQKHVIETNVVIIDLALPSIRLSPTNKITVSHGDKINIWCKITGGVPHPRISWVMKKDDNEYKDLFVSGEKLTVDHARLEDAGQYRCVATNSVGKADKTTEVIVQKTPMVVIEEGANKLVAYGSSVDLTCKITAYPLPEISWRDSRGNKLDSQNTFTNHEITSRLNLKDVKISGTYSCFAKNILGTKASTINVSVSSPFVVHSHPEATTSAAFGHKLKLECDISSSYPMEIKWNTPPNPSKISLSADKKVLTIESVSLADQGKYTCEATLKSDPKQKHVIETNVVISDLALPSIRLSPTNKITVSHGDKINIWCKITGGVPHPRISWVMKKDDNEYKDLFVSGEKLTVDHARLEDAGQYRCVATNSVGKADKTTEVIVQKTPMVVIEEGANKLVAYGSSVDLTCKITAYPLPEISWRDSRGNKLDSQNTFTNHEITSRLNLKDVKISGTYSCFAKNILGTKASTINVSVSSPFVVHSHPEATTSAAYGHKLKLECDISSSYPMEIKWNTPPNPSKISLSADKKVLTIESVSLADQGRYTCEATLKSDPKQKHVIETNVVISDLALPTIGLSLPIKITVSHGDKINIWCKITGGVPHPRISWAMKKDDNDYKDLSVSGEKLTVDHARLEDAGQYRCVATNSVGKADKTTEVIVLKTPVVVIEEGANKSVAYGSSLDLTCKITAYPLPEISWRDSRGNTLDSQNTFTNHVTTSRLNLKDVKVSGTYSCFAKNILGTKASNINVSVSSPFVVHSHPEGTISRKYGANVNITCDIKSTFSYKIRWFLNKALAVTEIHTSDKYTVSPTGTTLHILFTDLDTAGIYTCEASLTNDRNEKVNFTTNVHINDLSPPLVQDPEPKINVPNKNKVKIPCKIIGGIPPPVVSWQVMKKDDKVYRDLFASGQELTLDSATLVDAGQYRCTAKNAIGEAKLSTELAVLQAPEIIIDEGAAVTVPYGSTKEFKCQIVAFPLPKTTWRDSKGNELLSKNTIDNSHKVTSQLKVDNIKTFETYSCFAENYLGKTVNSVQVSVLSPIHFITKHPEITSVKHKRTAKIICDAKSQFSLRIKWFYQKNENSKISEIHTSANYLISSDNRTLEIMVTDLDLVGKYTCDASLVDDEREKKSFTTRVEINNLMAPEITDGDNTVTVMVGKRMSTVCKANGIPKPDVSWEFKSKASNAFTAIPNKGEQLIISRIGYEHAGSYKCTATNDVGTPKTRTIDVVVHGEPKITNVDSAYFGVTGDRVLKIPCDVTGIPKPTITWKHGDKYVDKSDSKIRVDKNALFINNPMEEDSSNFTCEARNNYGYATKRFVAIVSDFIDIDEDNLNLAPTYYLKPGESANIECRLPHSDSQSVRWYVNNEKTNVLGKFYSLKNVTFSNDGNYTCRLNTEQGSESQNYVVDVGYEPIFSKIQSSTINWNGNKLDGLDCYVNAKPKEEVQWFYNGELLNSENTSELYITNWGAYTCKVSNVHGSVQRTFNVTSDGCIIDRAVDRVQNTPLIIGDEPSIWPQFESDIEFLTISQNQILTLECSTLDQTDNTFKTHPNDKKIKAECYNEDKFIVNGKTFKFEELQCQNYVRPSHVFTKKPCMLNGEIMKVGFKLDNGFLEVYEVCYSKADDKTLNTKVVLSEANIGNLVGPSFMLNEGIKTGKQVSEIIKCQYNQRWLVNPKDVAFGPAQIATLSDKYNAVPVYEPCEGSSRLSWSSIENHVQSTMFIISTMTVWTGASQYNSKGIPRYLWKVVKIEGDSINIIMYVNDPNPDSSDILCQDNSSQDNEEEGIFSNLVKANDYTYICHIDDFLKLVNITKKEFALF